MIGTSAVRSRSTITQRLQRLAMVVIWLIASRTISGAEPVPASEGASPLQTATTNSLIPASDIREDLQSLYATLKEAHYDLYVHASRGRYDREYDRVLAAIRTPMSRLDVIRLFMPFVAFGQVAHASIGFPGEEFHSYGLAGGTVFPAELRIDRGRAFVTHNYSGDSRLDPGAQVVSLDGRPIAEWEERVGRYISADSPYLKSALMESWPTFPHLLWLDRGRADSFRIGVRQAGGQAGAFTIPAVPVGRLEEALRSRQAARFSREVKLLPGGIAYLRPGPFFDTYTSVTQGDFDPRIFSAFVDSAFRQILAARCTDLLIDLRGNPGGDNSFSDRMVAWFATRPFRFCSSYSLKASEATRSYYKTVAGRQLSKDDADASVAMLNIALASHRNGERFPMVFPMVEPRAGERFIGRVYALVDRFSYSMATSVAAQIQDYHFGRVLGEETADLPTSYGSVAQFTLQHTRILVNYPKGFLVRPNGCKRARGVVPDFPIDLPLYPVDEDAGLNGAIRAIRAQQAR